MNIIKVITMGGTIDAEAYPDDERLYPANATMTGQNAAFEALTDIYARHPQTLEDTQFLHRKICNKDSKDLDPRDINALISEINDSDAADRVIVTMGTDTMVQTARHVRENVDTPSCPIVFTGAIWPLANGETKSDGFTNLETAAFSFSDLRSDVYIAMGNIFATADTVEKDYANKQFIAVDDSSATP